MNTLRLPARFRLTSALVFALVLTGTVLAIFYPSLFTGRTLYGPDHLPIYRSGWIGPRVFTSFYGNWSDAMAGVGMGSNPFHPVRLLSFVLPPLAYHVGVYIIDSVLLALAALYLLRGLGITGWPAYPAAIGMALSGYSFTLIAAGHMGTFDMMPAAVFVLGLLLRAIRRGSAIHFAAAGLCAGFGMVGQPDVMVLFGLLAAAWAVFLLVVHRPREGRIAGFLASRAAGAALAAVVFVCVSIGLVSHLFRTVIPQRQAIARESQGDPWEFATNWSLPPADMLEFVAPCVYGIDSQNPDGPYWGALGRTLGWRSHRQGLMNLRQHTVYLGVLPICFALYGIAACLRRKPTEPDTSQKAAPIEHPRPFVLFWATAVAVSVMLALGRHFPLYRLFYMLPYASNIRCPVKFLHLVDVGINVLFALGLATALRDAFGAPAADGQRDRQGRTARSTTPRSGPRPRPLVVAAIAAAACGGILMIASFPLATPSPTGRLYAYWSELGLAPAAPQLARVMSAALRHGAWLFLAAAAFFLLASRMGRTARSRPILLTAPLLLLVALDTWSVSRRFVRVADFRPFYAANPVAEIVREDPDISRLSCPTCRHTWQDWLWSNLHHHHLDLIDPPVSHIPDDYRSYFTTIANQPLRLWQLTNTRYVLGPVKKLTPILSHPAFEAVQYLTARGGEVLPTGRGIGDQVLLRYSDALPRAAVYYDWVTLPESNALARLSEPSWNPQRTLLVTGASTNAVRSSLRPTPADILSRSLDHVSLSVRAKTPGILLLNDRFDPQWRVRLDGRPAELLRCNYLMRGVAIPTAGEHNVRFTYRPYLVPFSLSFGATLAILAWAALRAALHRLRTHRP